MAWITVCFIYKWLNRPVFFQWREMSVEIFWLRPGVKRVMGTALLCLYQTAVETGTNQYYTTGKLIHVFSGFLQSHIQEVDQRI